MKARHNWGSIILYGVFAALGIAGTISHIVNYATGVWPMPTGQIMVSAIGWGFLYLVIAIFGIICLILAWKGKSEF